MSVTTWWVCGRCGEEHTSETRAWECCPVDVYPIHRCEVCGNEHEDIVRAEACCEDSEAEPPRASRWELEAAGQLNFLSGGV